MKCVAVQISPANPSVAPGGTVQFSATVTNTSNTAVTWSAMPAQISSNGLFTAPSNTAAKTISVTASSLAQTGALSTTTVTISSSTFAITTSSVPFAVQAQPYSQPLTATGGQTPYQWSIASELCRRPAAWRRHRNAVWIGYSAEPLTSPYWGRMRLHTLRSRAFLLVYQAGAAGASILFQNRL